MKIGIECIVCGKALKAEVPDPPDGGNLSINFTKFEPGEPVHFETKAYVCSVECHEEAQKRAKTLLDKDPLVR